MYAKLALRLLLALPFVAVIAGGCKDAAIDLQSDRTVIAAGGCDQATITATVTIGGKTKANARVEFETTSGSFSPAETLQSTSATTDAEGKATVNLYATTSVGSATVNASYDDDNYSVAQSVTVTFGPPTGRFAPVSDSISLSCDALNVGALRSGASEIVIPCTLTAQTADGCALPAAAFMSDGAMVLKAEAGTLEAVVDSWDQTVVLHYRTKGGQSKPADVDPVSGEPSRPGPLGETLNPRDGVITLLAVLRGKEAFDDLNGNGVFDEDSETFDDIGEPFLDIDDDGVFTLGTDPYFADSDGDGSQSGPNGTYDATAYIGASTKIIWSGDLEEAADAARLELEGNGDIPNGGSVKAVAYLLDARLNPIAAWEENSDYIYFDISGWLIVNPSSYQIQLTNKSAIRFDDQLRYLEYVPDAAAYPITLSDDDGSTTYDPPYDWTLAATVYASAGPDADGYFSEQTQYTFEHSLSGTNR